MSIPPIRTSTLPADPNSTAAPESRLQKQIIDALLYNGGHSSIEHVLDHELAASGWTTNLRTYVQMLFRSGECTTFNEAMERVMKCVGVGGRPGNEKKEVNGETTNGAGPSSAAGSLVTQHQPIKDMENGGQLSIPEKVVTEGVKAVRKELEKICEIEVDDV
jgi:hypothetical protein